MDIGDVTTDTVSVHEAEFSLLASTLAPESEIKAEKLEVEADEETIVIEGNPDLGVTVSIK